MRRKRDPAQLEHVRVPFVAQTEISDDASEPEPSPEPEGESAVDAPAGEDAVDAAQAEAEVDAPAGEDAVDAPEAEAEVDAPEAEGAQDEATACEASVAKTSAHASGSDALSAAFPRTAVIIRFGMCFCLLWAFFRLRIFVANVAESQASSSVGYGTVAWQEAGGKPGGKTYTMPLTRQLVPMMTAGDRVNYKSAYWGTVSVGYPAVAFKVVFDTGSGHLILPSSFCHSHTCRLHRRYRRSASSSGKDIDSDGTEVAPGEARDQITVNFGTGEVTGIFMEETVCLGDTVARQDFDDARASKRPLPGTTALAGTKLPQPPEKLRPDCMRLRTIMAVEMSQEPFKTFQFDGILGLGLTALSQHKEYNFVDAVASVVLDDMRMFAVFLSATDMEPSEITLGGWKPNRLAGPLYWNDVYKENHGHWMVGIRAVRVDNTTVAYCKRGCKAVADTGTSLLSVPPDAFPELFEFLKHSPYSGHCRGHGPLLHFELDNFTVTLTPKDYARPINNTDSASSGLTSAKLELGQICKPMLMSMELACATGAEALHIRFGEPILRKYYTVYDAREQRIGFGLSAGTEKPEGVANEEDSLLESMPIGASEASSLLSTGFSQVIKAAQELGDVAQESDDVAPGARREMVSMRGASQKFEVRRNGATSCLE
eukprot:CAMPEP_0117535658 /NCGR_PEP_ID=MMETSP0784-20121206/41048_1 /TAXON_ID=39447 /ORGANISM="" /LENGTH=655 /DNA_ID=CAMNT_0005332191 /DNA_START=89 /DNA_END=2051 /DNA_ORIENTATION=+